MAATSASLLYFGGLVSYSVIAAMAVRFKLLKSLFSILLLVGDLGLQPASLEAHLPRTPPQEDQANILFSPTHFALLDFRHSFSSLVAVVGLVVITVLGLFLLILKAVFVSLLKRVKTAASSKHQQSSR